MSESLLVLVQIGYQKSIGKRPGQLVKAFICFRDGGEESIEWSSDPEQGSYLTERAKSREMCWYMAKRSLSDGDAIRFEIFTGRQGLGEDTQLTMKKLYRFDENTPVREFSESYVGFRRFPLVKGRFVEIESVSKRDEMDRELDEMVADEEKM
jgi:hypothetical protein